MKPVAYLCAYLALTATALAAQVPQPASDTIEKQANRAQPKTETTDRPSSDKEPPKSSEPSSAPPKKFVPKEKIPADSTIAFPVDI